MEPYTKIHLEAVKKFGNVARESKRWLARQLRASIPEAGCKRAGNTAGRRFWITPKGLHVIFARPALLARSKTAAGIATGLAPGPSQKSNSNATFPNFFTASQESFV